MISINACKAARRSKDARFDGLFFIGVKTTGIYCRSTCPANPKEENVIYFSNASLAINAGYRPCLRCHPDSAPGVSVTKTRHDKIYAQAIEIFEQGTAETNTLSEIAENLGVSPRYFRKIFIKRAGISPKFYLLLQQTLFAKKLLHQTSFTITEIAYASGFGSIRRFNDHFKKNIGMQPTAIRNRQKIKIETIDLKLHYRPPYDWPEMRDCFSSRLIEGMEWIDQDSYGRTFSLGKIHGEFVARHKQADHCFEVSIKFNEISSLRKVVSNIKRILDLDTDVQAIQDFFYSYTTHKQSGLAKNTRLPGIWSFLEAWIWAIFELRLGTINANKLMHQLAREFGEKSEKNRLYFPTAKQIYTGDLHVLKIPDELKSEIDEYSRICEKLTLTSSLQQLSENKNIPQAVVDIAKIYGLGRADVYLGKIKTIKQFLKNEKTPSIPIETFSPYRSYYYHQLYHMSLRD